MEPQSELYGGDGVVIKTHAALNAFLREHKPTPGDTVIGGPGAALKEDWGKRKEPESPPDVPPAYQQEIDIRKILNEGAVLFVRKNAEYGNAIVDTGLLGAVVAATGDIARLRQLVLRSPDTGQAVQANVRDKLIDIMVQAAIGIYMLDRGNWVGE